MKKSVGVVALLCMALAAQAQKEVVFKLKVMPKHHYVSTMKMGMDMQMKVSTADGKTSDGPEPVNMKMDYSLVGDMSTKSAAPTGNVPFTMTIKMGQANATMNGQPLPGAAGAMPTVNETLYGSYSTAGKMSLDSVGGKKGDETVKASMMKMVESFQSGLTYPDKPMKVGDTFVQNTPVDMPIPGMAAAKMNNAITYKLTQIVDNKAYFDLSYVMSTDVGSAMVLNGTGDGKLVYDITAAYPVDVTSNMSCTYNMTVPGQDMKMAGTMKIATGNTTVITE